ncbi:M3 family oligoendopeptidase [Paenibacillus thalictri]|uniref:M3 family oligoendopeptidase n=1 Tax=Paenibacillus thalictri TaxID=2527873 RepID=A0A4Q9DMP4_9BACL|nr:M3 family oligoendopeptidase [Paenibacillus thalictri]TBL74000.1 M3 family oligoendopeptidase [Paenibacillus thalictri]
MKLPLQQTWDLERIFPGGSDSAAFGAFLDRMEQDIQSFQNALQSAEPPATIDHAASLVSLVEQLQSILVRLRESDSFTACLAAQNQQDKRAVLLGGRVKTVAAAYEASLTRFDQLLTQVPDDVWNGLMQHESLKAIQFPLAERRALAGEKLAPELEALAGDLAVDGYHGWGELYNTAVGKFRLTFEEDGKTVDMSAGQAANKMHSPDRQVRERLFAQWEMAWEGLADYCADALNRLGGFRLQLYKHRGWKEIHKEPLAINRMSAETLHTMWDVIERNKPVFVGYLQRKAKLLGVPKLSWHDVEAPVGGGGKHFGYDEGAQLIVEQFRRFSPKLADFTEMAFEQRWIEAEDRPGKRPGGFCTSFPAAHETRIFMTYAGTASNVSTLAHELGHAYHQHVMNDLPALAQEYAMNVAETASTFAEMVVADAALQGASGTEERMTLLEDKIQRSVAFYMNIHARFIFETAFYEERKKGLVSTDKLNELMLDAQKTAFQDALAEYHPHFWASKLHFYITEVPFYNFPYTFGYMFSAGIYAAALQQGAAFEDKYVALLRDTGSMTVEDLAMKHLGVDLRKPDFWQQAMDMSIADVNEFMRLTE